MWEAKVDIQRDPPSLPPKGQAGCLGAGVLEGEGEGTAVFAPSDTGGSLEGCSAVPAGSGDTLGVQGRCSAPAGPSAAPSPAARNVLAPASAVLRAEDPHGGPIWGFLWSPAPALHLAPRGCGPNPRFSVFSKDSPWIRAVGTHRRAKVGTQAGTEPSPGQLQLSVTPELVEGAGGSLLSGRLDLPRGCGFGVGGDEPGQRPQE